ncbi:MAG: hypothetical protein AB1498_02840 [bacterium]
MKKDIIEQEKNTEGLETAIKENIQNTFYDKLIEKEIGVLKKFLESKQTDQLYRKYGLTLLYSLDYKDMVAYEKELGIKPQTVADFYNHGVYYAAKNNINHAMKCFQKVIEMDNKFAPAYYNMALIYQAGKEDKSAKTSFSEFIRLEEEKIKQCGKKIELEDAGINYLEEAKKMIKALK